ncbi:MAG: hypothetical protein AAGA48_17745 [Myxococcota bacterium]
MPKTTTVRFDDHVSEEVMKQLALLAAGASALAFHEGLAHLFVEDEELSLFADWDFLWGRGRGTYTQDDAECRSRRVDLRGPHDGDPGPLPMEEAPDDITAKHLILAPPTPPGF